MKVLLSIKPNYANSIFNGKKKFEFRKAIFKRKEVNTVIVYSTMPVGKIIGEFKIKAIINDEPDQIWNKTKKYAGINREYFDTYFSGRKKAYAIEIEQTELYSEPIDPYKSMKGFYPPQSFRYLKE